MNQVKLNEIIRSKRITIPLYVLKMYKEFNLNVEEIILLLYLYDLDGVIFDPERIANDLDMEVLNVIENIGKLSDKGLINILTKVNNSKVKEEVLDLTPLFDKITLNVVNKLNKDNEKNDNIYRLIEEEFNRKLSPMECDMVDSWEKNGYSHELITEATKEAVLNGVNALRYIDKILYDWNKKGYKKKEDIKRDYSKEKKVEIYNCDWLDSDEEL